jgi:hypothetical protein
VVTARGDTVNVVYQGELDVGCIEPAMTPRYARAVRRAESKGRQVWVHGQVERDGVDLVVVLHCPDPEVF